MSQEITVRAPREVVPVSDPNPLFDTAAFDHMCRVAKMMVHAYVTPESLVCRYEGTGQSRVTIPLEYEQAFGNCFQVVNQARRWNMDPFAVAQCCSVVHGKLMFEGKLVAAVIDSLLGVKLGYEWNDKTGEAFGIKVFGPKGAYGEERFVEGTVGDWKTTGSNSPWTKKSQQRIQLAYRGNREWCRLFEPQLLLGVYTPDEVDLTDRPERASPRRLPTPTPEGMKQIEAGTKAPEVETQAAAADGGQDGGAQVEDAQVSEIQTGTVEDQVAAQQDPAAETGDEGDQPAQETPDEILAELRDRLGFAKTAEEVEEAYTDFDPEPMLEQFEGGAEKAQQLKALRLATIAPLEEEKPAEQLPASRFDTPAITTAAEYEAWFKTMFFGVDSLETAEKLHAAWERTADMRKELLDGPAIRRLKDAVAEVLAPYQASKGGKAEAAEKPTETPAEKPPVDTTVEATSAEMYVEQYRALGAAAKTFKDFRAIGNRWMNESALRVKLGVTNKQRDLAQSFYKPQTEALRPKD